MNITLNEMRDMAYSQAVTTGWHDKELSNDHYKSLIITELSEAVQADRNGKRALLKMYRDNVNTPQLHPEEHRKFVFERFIKDSVEDELADAVIRCLDFAGLNHIELRPNDNFGYLISQNKTFTENIYAIIREFCNPAWHIEDHIRIAISMIYKLAELKGIDLRTFIELKMAYNRLRPHMHGGKRY